MLLYYPEIWDICTSHNSCIEMQYFRKEIQSLYEENIQAMDCKLIKLNF